MRIGNIGYCCLANSSKKVSKSSEDLGIGFPTTQPLGVNANWQTAKHLALHWLITSRPRQMVVIAAKPAPTF